MYATGPPGGPANGTGSLRIRRVSRKRYEQPARAFERADVRPRIHTYLSDLVRPYGLPVRDELVTAGAGFSYGEMAAELVGATVPAGTPVDLLVLAYAVPDIWPGRATAVYLGELCPGQPLAFAISDQGAAAAFTGLRLAREYAATGGCHRSLLLVVEQPTLHYPPAGPAPLPTAAAGVALLCDSLPGRGPAVRTVRQHPDVAAEQVPAILEAELAELGLAPDATVILGPALSNSNGRRNWRYRTAATGAPYTGAWSELADELASDTTGQLVLADYDPALRYLCLAVLSDQEST